jgi:hypothetical protein
MKTLAFVAMAAVVTASAQAGQTVTVYVQNSIAVPNRTLIDAEGIASRIFGPVGVRIDWRRGALKQGAIAVRVSEATPENYYPGTFGIALTYEGVHITVFYDRIRKLSSQSVIAAALGHVLAHEIAHILEGIDRHSESGLMKAHWTDEDIAEMVYKPLPFAPEDLRLINSGLEKRAGLQQLTAAATYAKPWEK